ncbi:hypothetical protein CMEL01_00036 [Colletotrichum melonis]|uniref:Uncharacterized protein n=1 Tax=Colletotrichum melonis TaxID=1209925 RepID=A0AAI9Y0X8_9PEZI|nr:hypothetical protein CMEL01_00036 [Colletotrichum melonis]
MRNGRRQDKAMQKEMVPQHDIESDDDVGALHGHQRQRYQKQQTVSILHSVATFRPPGRPQIQAKLYFSPAAAESPLHDGAGNGDAAALVSVALDALRLAARGLGGLDDAVDDGSGGAAGAVAVDKAGGS